MLWGSCPHAQGGSSLVRKATATALEGRGRTRRRISSLRGAGPADCPARPEGFQIVTGNPRGILSEMQISGRHSRTVIQSRGGGAQNLYC